MNRTPVANRLGRHLCLPRLMLLVLLAMGVAGMHTLGHADGSAHTGSSLSGQGYEHVAMDLHAVAEDSSAAAMPDESTEGGLHVLAFTVCLGVIGAGAILLLRSLARRARRAGPIFHLSGRNLTWRSGRGPPDRPVGLRLAEVSVLRL
nr:DUF6153 family protein [Micromonospora purpureochromogenes]